MEDEHNCHVCKCQDLDARKAWRIVMAKQKWIAHCKGHWSGVDKIHRLELLCGGWRRSHAQWEWSKLPGEPWWLRTSLVAGTLSLEAHTSALKKLKLDSTKISNHINQVFGGQRNWSRNSWMCPGTCTGVWFRVPPQKTSPSCWTGRGKCIIWTDMD